MIIKTILAIVTVILFSIYSNVALSAVDDNASIVHLRTSCTENGSVIANCFESTAEVTNWIKSIKLPNAKNPLLVDIGTGRFGNIILGCDLGKISNISFRGAGMGVTRLGRPARIENAVDIRDCDAINFQDITITGGAFITIYWQGNGSSTWTNVEVIAGQYAWSETGCDSTLPRPKHYWFNSRIHSIGKTAYLAACSENWIFGSELINEGYSAGTSSTIIAESPNGSDSIPEIHIYGSVLRNIMPAGRSYTPIAATAGRNGQIHIHGTGIDVIGNDLPNDIIALQANAGGTIHAAQSAFVMKTSNNGKAIRIKNNGGSVRAPYLWENEILESATSINLVSTNGADSVMELVCSDASCTKKYPHLMVYTSDCGSTPWFDTVTGSCR